MNKRTFINLFLFVLCNAVGFTVAPLIFVLSINFGFLDLENSTTDLQTIQHTLIVMPTLMWLPCAVFSIAFFVLKNPWRTFFLIMPIIAPLIFVLAKIQSVL